MVFVLPDLFRYGPEYFLVKNVDQALLDEIPVDDEAHFPHWGGPFEMTDQLLLFAGEVKGGQFGEDGDPVIELYHAAEGLEAAGFIVEVTTFLAGLAEFAEPDDLTAEAMTFFEQPKFVGVDI